jgi:hypothetical protein
MNNRVARVLAVVCLVAFFAVPLAVAGPDFEPEVLARVRRGEVVVDNLVQSNKEFRIRFRAFFPKGTPEGFVRLVTDHGRFPRWIPEVRSAETLAVEEDGTVFSYRADVFIDLGLIQETLAPEGTQRVRWPDAPGGETHLRNTLTNYTSSLQFGEERTRLVPFQGGFLSDTTVEAVLRQELDPFFAQLARREIRARCKRLVERARDELARTSSQHPPTRAD